MASKTKTKGKKGKKGGTGGRAAVPRDCLISVDQAARLGSVSAASIRRWSADPEGSGFPAPVKLGRQGLIRFHPLRVREYFGIADLPGDDDS